MTGVGKEAVSTRTPERRENTSNLKMGVFPVVISLCKLCKALLYGVLKPYMSCMIATIPMIVRVRRGTMWVPTGT